MENNLNPIDNFFKENLSEIENKDKKGNWELMNHLLNEEETKRKRRWFIIFFLFAGLIITSGLIFFFTNNESSKQKLPAETKAVANSKYHTDSKMQGKHIHVPASHDLPVVQNQQDIESSVGSKEEHSERLSKALKETGNEKPFATTKHNPGTSRNQTRPDEKNIQLTEAEAPSSNEIKNEPEIKSTVPELLLPDKKITGDSLTATFVNDSTTDSSIDSMMIDHDIKDSALQAASTVTATDSSSQINNLRYEIALYAGANFYQTGFGSWSVSPVAGLAYRKLLGKMFIVEVACFYSLQGGYDLNDSETVVTESYFLDKETNVYSASINIKKQHKLYLPVTFHYKIAERHSLLGAMQFSFLLNTEGDYSEKNIISGITSETNRKNVKGYMDGIRTTNYGLSLGYQYKLSKNFDIQARITRDLLGSFSDDYFYGVETNPLWSLQAFIIFKF